MKLNGDASLSRAANPIHPAVLNDFRQSGYTSGEAALLTSGQKLIVLPVILPKSVNAGCSARAVSDAVQSVGGSHDVIIARAVNSDGR